MKSKNQQKKTRNQTARIPLISFVWYKHYQNHTEIKFKNEKENGIKQKKTHYDNEYSKTAAGSSSKDMNEMQTFIHIITEYYYRYVALAVWLRLLLSAVIIRQETENR